MSLHVILSVNAEGRFAERIGHATITRVRPRGVPEAGQLCEYRWEVTLANRAKVASRKGEELVHHFGGNPWDLVWKALLAAHYSDGWSEDDGARRHDNTSRE